MLNAGPSPAALEHLGKAGSREQLSRLDAQVGQEGGRKGSGAQSQSRERAEVRALRQRGQAAENLLVGSWGGKLSKAMSEPAPRSTALRTLIKIHLQDSRTEKSQSK